MKRCSTSLLIREMQIKTISYYLTPISMATIKKNPENSEYWRGCREIGTFVHCWWEWKMVQPLWKHYAIAQKIKHRMTIWSSNSISGYVSQRTESRNLERYLYTHVHSSTIHNYQKLEATQVSMDRWMDKQNVVCTYSGVLFSLKKERDCICYNMDESWGHFAKWNKPDIRRQILYDCTSMRYLEGVKIIETEVEWWLPVTGGRWEWSYCLMGAEFHFCMMKRVLEMYGGDVCTAVWMNLIPLNCTLKKG